jgi:hypothetical protein
VEGSVELLSFNALQKRRLCNRGEDGIEIEMDADKRGTPVDFLIQPGKQITKGYCKMIKLRPRVERVKKKGIPNSQNQDLRYGGLAVQNYFGQHPCTEVRLSNSTQPSTLSHTPLNH